MPNSMNLRISFGCVVCRSSYSSLAQMKGCMAGHGPTAVQITQAIGRIANLAQYEAKISGSHLRHHISLNLANARAELQRLVDKEVGEGRLTSLLKLPPHLINWLAYNQYLRI